LACELTVSSILEGTIYLLEELKKLISYSETKWELLQEEYTRICIACQSSNSGLALEKSYFKGWIRDWVSYINCYSADSFEFALS